MFGRQPDKEQRSYELHPAESPATDALILICEKCGKKLARDDENPARDLQQALKSEIKSRGLKGQMRAAVTSCLDLCPKNELAICVSKAGGKNEFFTIDDGFQKRTEEFAQTILDQVKKS